LSLPGSRKGTPVRVILTKNDEIIVENNNEKSHESYEESDKNMMKS